MLADDKSNSQQILQAVLDESSQALKVTAVGAGGTTDLTQIDGNATETSYGTPGAGSLRVAAMIGVGSTAVSASNPLPVNYHGATRTFQAAGSILASSSTISTTPVTVATNGATPATFVQVLNSCSVTLRLVINSVNSLILMPNSAVEVPLAVGASQVVAVQREGSTDATTGYVVVNLFS